MPFAQYTTNNDTFYNPHSKRRPRMESWSAMCGCRIAASARSSSCARVVHSGLERPHHRVAAVPRPSWEDAEMGTQTSVKPNDTEGTAYGRGPATSKALLTQAGPGPA